MNILICDDEEVIVEQIKKYTFQFFQRNKLPLPHITTYTCGTKLLEEKAACDILLIDIEMPDSNGINVAKEMKKSYPNLILFFITSYSEYLDDALRIDVFRYLSKPLDKQRFFRNMEDAIEHYKLISKPISIETSSGTFIHSSDEIIMVEGFHRKLKIYTKNQVYECTKPLKEFIAELSGPMFFQSHRSYVVNLAYVSFFEHDIIKLCNNQFCAYLTKRKYTAFRTALSYYNERKR